MFTYKRYQHFLYSYRQARDKREIGKLISLLPYLLALCVMVWLSLKRIHFPSRKKGSWWFVVRWRFEFLKRFYEYNTVQHFQEHIQPGMTVLDIGAHIGYFTMLFSELVGPTGCVIAFEPCPENFAILVKNLQAPHYAKNVVIENMAVSAYRGNTRLFFSKGHSSHTLIKAFRTTDEYCNVETVTVDGYLQSRGNPCIGAIKIDVEGAEPQVFAGMQMTLKRNPDIVVVFECNSKALHAAGWTVEDFLSHLKRLGFDPEPIPETGAHKVGTVNYAFITKRSSIPL